MQECPVCGLPLPEDELVRQRHVNDCLDFGGGKDDDDVTPTTQRRNSVPPIVPSTSYACPVCEKDISALSLTNRQAHVSRCCAHKEGEKDATTVRAGCTENGSETFMSKIRKTIEHNEKENSSLAVNTKNSAPRMQACDMKSDHYRCRLCMKDLSASTYEQRVAHVKKCSRSTQSASTCNHRSKEKDPSADKENSGIVAWLQSLGLEKYAEAFIKEEISLDLVGSLTDSDLMTLGVVSLGARRKILTSCCALPIPSTSLSSEFAALKQNNRSSKHSAAVKNNRRITQFMGPRKGQQRGQQTASTLVKGAKRSRLGNGQESSSGVLRESRDNTITNQASPSPGWPCTTNIGNSNLAICGDKKTLKSLWNYAGE